MNNSTVNFTPDPPTNATTLYLGLTDSLILCISSFGFLCGLPTHSSILWLIITGSGVASEFFNLNLSVCEIGISLNCFIFAISYWFFSLSTIQIFFVGLSMTGRPLFQCLMCVERFLAVVHPVIFLKYKPLRYRLICCTVAWIFTLGSCLCGMNIWENVYAYLWFVSTQFLFFLSVQLFCLVSVLRALKQSGPGERNRGNENHMKRRAFYLILITSVGMTFTYGPYIIIGFISIVIEQGTDPLSIIGYTCYMLAGFVDPVVYLACAGKLPCLCLPQFLIKTRG